MSTNDKMTALVPAQLDKICRRAQCFIFYDHICDIYYA